MTAAFKYLVYEGTPMGIKNKVIDQEHFHVEPGEIDINLSNSDFNLKIVRKNHPQNSIFTIRNMLSPTECQTIISAAEYSGFQKSGLAIGNDVYRTKEKTRNNLRMMFEDKQLALDLWARIANLVELKYENHYAYGLNWRFRVYKYECGGRFAPHQDERMVLPGDDLTTYFSLMVYLSDNFSGGETTFFERRKKGSKKLVINRTIKPKNGMALAFDHLLFHEGTLVKQGIKYVLRTDIIYSKNRC